MADGPELKKVHLSRKHPCTMVPTYPRGIGWRIPQGRRGRRRYEKYWVDFFEVLLTHGDGLFRVLRRSPLESEQAT